MPGNSGGPVVDRRGLVLGVLAIGSEITGAGEFILNSTFVSALPSWTAKTFADDFRAPPPNIVVTDWNWDTTVCNPGCPMRATVTNFGGPAAATVIFIVYASNKSELARCAKRVTLSKGDTVITRCVVSSARLTSYFYGYSFRRVGGGNVVITSQAAVAS
jgi:hypothetical protein